MAQIRLKFMTMMPVASIYSSFFSSPVRRSPAGRKG
jgi:hypothetical protein